MIFILEDGLVVLDLACTPFKNWRMKSFEMLALIIEKKMNIIMKLNIHES
jgi:hypothetical protein